MNLALELFLSAAAMVFTIVIIAELIWKAQKLLGRRK